MNAFLYISPSFKSSGKYCHIEIKCIDNIHLPNGYEYPSEKHEVDCPHFPILIQRGEGKFECLDDASYWASITKQYQATHLRCFVVDDSKHSVVETQELKIMCEFYIPATRSSVSCERFIEEYYTNPYFKGLIQRFFFLGRNMTDECFFSLLGAWGKTLRTLGRRKAKHDAVTPHKKEVESPEAASQKQSSSDSSDKAHPKSNEELWNQFARTKGALCYEEVIKLLNSEEKIKTFDALISDNQLDQAIQRLNKYIEKLSHNGK
ncbi:hypothetical protein Ga0123462_1127 [Mariprofundus ferrinatatus]|uniref:Uncharacterized protein n=1 Tax=Mariprofundus ferrinatatus TaxID=1921087 RepID=A0A2K8L810_9PROT|nr:hypothetical protein [Mariprofundus ferrinatatus]ATX81991.1 hypothetical protein Ga0123462_1127 [Mariprofundus ferrinatatus]